MPTSGATRRMPTTSDTAASTVSMGQAGEILQHHHRASVGSAPNSPRSASISSPDGTPVQSMPPGDQQSSQRQAPWHGPSPPRTTPLSNDAGLAARSAEPRTSTEPYPITTPSKAPPTA